MDRQALDRLLFPGLVAGVVAVFWLVGEATGTVDVLAVPRPPYAVGIDDVEAVAMILLTAGLFVVYRQQRRILDEQKSLAEYQQSALPQVDEHRVVPRRESREYQERAGDGNPTLRHSEPVEFTLSNHGQAPASDLRCELYVEAGGTAHSLPMPMVRGEWRDALDYLHSSSMGGAFLDTRGNAIPAGREAEAYTAVLYDAPRWIPDAWKRGPIHAFPPPSSVLGLAKRAVETDFLLGFALWYRDGVGPRDPFFSRFVRVPREAVVGTDDLRDGDLTADDLTDLADLFDAGEPVAADDIPDLAHPSER